MSTAQLALRGGTGHDGLGSPGRVADVRVARGRIAGVGRIAGADAEVIDCDGLVVCPGFIDVHAHSDVLPLPDDPAPFQPLIACESLWASWKFSR